VSSFRVTLSRETAESKIYAMDKVPFYDYCIYIYIIIYLLIYLYGDFLNKTSFPLDKIEMACLYYSGYVAGYYQLCQLVMATAVGRNNHLLIDWDPPECSV